MKKNTLPILIILIFSSCNIKTGNEKSYMTIEEWRNTFPKNHIVITTNFEPITPANSELLNYTLDELIILKHKEDSVHLEIEMESFNKGTYCSIEDCVQNNNACKKAKKAKKEGKIYFIEGEYRYLDGRTSQWCFVRPFENPYISYEENLKVISDATKLAKTYFIDDPISFYWHNQDRIEDVISHYENSKRNKDELKRLNTWKEYL